MNMPIEWEFAEIPKNMEERDPHEDVFFNKGNKSEALVREFIQNALDAQRDDSDRVKVDITFDIISEGITSHYLKGLGPHLEKSGLKSDTFDMIEHKVLVLEDFGTTGLDGETQRKEAKANNQKSNFYDFWWSEGKSEKGGGNIGSWGLGKTTYHMASDIKTFWGLTIRQDDKKELLMGKSLLKSHVLDGNLYHYSGKYKVGDNEPISDEKIISKFKEDLPIRRNSEEGFSVAIPLADRNINLEAVTKYAIKHYFFAILNGELELEIRDLTEDDDPIIISANTMPDLANMIEWKGTGWEDRNVNELIEFTQETIAELNSDKLKEIDPNNKLEGLESFEDKEELEEKFSNGEFVSVKVPVELNKKDGGRTESAIYLFMKKFPDRYDMRPDEFYIRSGIHIADEYSDKLGSRPVRAMLVVEDDEVSRFLAGAEEPAHLEWNASLDGYKEDYENAWSTLRFIRNSLNRVIQTLDHSEEEKIEDLLENIFSIEPSRDYNDNEERKKEKDGQNQKGGDKSKDKKPGKIGRGRKYTQVNPTENGFKVKFDREEDDIPVKRKIKVAYDTYAGDPFNNYEKFDFDLSDPRMSVQSKDVNITKREKNIIDLEFISEDSWIKVEGFDPNRDLVVRVVSQ